MSRGYSNRIDFGQITPDMARGGESSHKVKMCSQSSTAKRAGLPGCSL